MNVLVLHAAPAAATFQTRGQQIHLFATCSRSPGLDYTIQGDNLQIIRIRLKPGQELYAEAGKMIYKQPQVVWKTRMSGATLGEKVWGAIKRKMMGESLFLTYFHSATPGENRLRRNVSGTHPVIRTGRGSERLRTAR